MQAEIITIGDELLIGQVVDTNSAFIAQQLNKIGVSVYQITSIQDDAAHILKALDEAEQNADIIILTGGLGPTKDDITKTTLAAYFNDTFVLNEAVLQHIKKLWKKYVEQPLLQVNKDQALIPSKAAILTNKYGTAPGMWFKTQQKVIVSLPGVPLEMKEILVNELIPKLQQEFKFPYIEHKTLITYGIGESALAARIESWETALPSFIKLAYLPNVGKVRLRLTAKGNSKTKLLTAIQQQIELLKPLIKDVLVGVENNESIETRIATQLTVKNKTLSVAESCTGGAIAQAITAHSGASQFFKGSIVTYATQTKIAVLGVPEEVIARYTVVSTQVAHKMAVQCLKMFKTDYAVATTGNAGPKKGDSDAEVGTVCIAVASKKGVVSKEFNFGNHRIQVINRATTKAFELLLAEILKN